MYLYATISKKELPTRFNISKKHKISITIVNDGDVQQTINTEWSGGSRNIFSKLNLKTGWRTLVPGPAWGSGIYSVPIPTKEDEVVTITGTFCGKEATPRITIGISKLPLIFDETVIQPELNPELNQVVALGVHADRLEELGCIKTANLIRLLTQEYNKNRG